MASLPLSDGSKRKPKTLESYFRLQPCSERCERFQNRKARKEPFYFGFVKKSERYKSKSGRKNEAHQLEMQVYLTR